MTTKKEDPIKASKKAAAHISKFTYHLNHTIPDIF